MIYTKESENGEELGDGDGRREELSRAHSATVGDDLDDSEQQQRHAHRY